MEKERITVAASKLAMRACNLHRLLKKKAKGEIVLIVVNDHAYTFRKDAERIEAAPQIGLIVGWVGEEKKIPATGFARELMDAYLPKMVACGFRVAVCDVDKRQIRHL